MKRAVSLGGRQNVRHKFSALVDFAAPAWYNNTNADNGGIVWSDRKRIAFGLPWTFTKYTLTKEKLLIHTGMLNTQEDEVRLYRIMDVTLRRSLWERMFGLGTIHCCSADKSTPEFDIAWVKDAAQVKETLSDMVEAERMAKRVSSREFMTDDEDGEML